MDGGRSLRPCSWPGSVFSYFFALFVFTLPAATKTACFLYLALNLRTKDISRLISASAGKGPPQISEHVAENTNHSVIRPKSRMPFVRLGVRTRNTFAVENNLILVPFTHRRLTLITRSHHFVRILTDAKFCIPIKLLPHFGRRSHDGRMS